MRFSLAMLGSVALVLGACGGSTDGGLGGGATDGGAASGGSAGSSGSSGTGGDAGAGGGNVGGSGGNVGGSGGNVGGSGGNVGGSGGNVGGSGGNVGGSGGNVGGSGGSVGGSGGVGGNVGGSGGNTGGSAGAGGAATSCSGVCQKLDQANCPNDAPYSACFAGCQIDVDNYQAQCGSQVSSWLTCVQTSGQVTCNNDGESIVTGCNSQLIAFTQCAACIPSTGDDACEACSKTACCNQLKAVYSHPQFPGYLSCIYGCSTQQCENNCYFQYSGLQTVFTQLLQCQGSNCAAC